MERINPFMFNVFNENSNFFEKSVKIDPKVNLIYRRYHLMNKQDFGNR